MDKTAENNIIRFLVEHGKISQQQFKKIVDEAKEINISPDRLLETKKNFSEEDIAWAKSQIYNIPVADLYGKIVPREILEIIPEDIAQNYQLAAFDKEGDVLKIVVLDPGNFKSREAIDFIARQKNLKISYYVSPVSSLKNILAQYRGLSVEVKEAVGAAESRFVSGKSELGVSEMDLEKMGQSAPISKLVGSILKFAVDNNASDVHIEPYGDKTRVRCRIDGRLKESAMLPGHLHSSIISRVKVMANLKLDETRVPQDAAKGLKL